MASAPGNFPAIAAGSAKGKQVRCEHCPFAVSPSALAVGENCLGSFHGFCLLFLSGCFVFYRKPRAPFGRLPRQPKQNELTDSIINKILNL